MTERQWPEADWSAEPWAHVAETHSAVVFFAGDRALQAEEAAAAAGTLAPSRLIAAWEICGRVGRSPGRGPPGFQAAEDLLVGDLREPRVELPDGGKFRRRVYADHLVGSRADLCLPPRRRDGHGEHNPRRFVRPGDLAGGPGGGPGSDAVIDHHGHLPG